MYRKSTVCLLNNETDTNNIKDTNNLNYICDNNYEDNKLLSEIKKFKFNDDLKDDFNNILKQSKVVFNNAINQDQYQDLIDDNVN